MNIKLIKSWNYICLIILEIYTLAINVQPNPVQFVQMNTEYWVVPIQHTDPLHHEGVMILICFVIHILELIIIKL